MHVFTHSKSLPLPLTHFPLPLKMFRKHAALLNGVPRLEAIFCDEGHRLKNIGGTKTIQALR